MDKKDWDAIIAILKEIEDGLNNAKQNYYATAPMSRAFKIAQNRRQLASEKGDG